MIAIHIDEVEAGTMIYSAAGVPLGVIRNYLEMNGNSAAIPRRRLDNGKWADRFAYRRDNLYRLAKGTNGGVVYVKAAEARR